MDRPTSLQDSLFDTCDLKLVNKSKIPCHVAIIPDGNRRWAKNNLLPNEKGYVAGGDNVVRIVRAAQELGIKVLTIYFFSTENWKRPRQEIEPLMQLIQEYLINYQEQLVSHNIRLCTIGDLEGLPQALQAVVEETKAITAKCTDFDLVLALNYGGRNEIVRAISRLIAKNTLPEEISEETFSQQLDTRFWPDPELLIRTSGERRISNFLLWQSSYSEVYVDNVAWPDFNPKHLLQAVCDYQSRERRLGGHVS